MGFFHCHLRSGRGGPGQELYSSVASFSSLPGILSGPDALWGLMSFRSFRPPLMLTFKGGVLGVWLCLRSGRSDMSSWVKTELN